MHPRQSRIPRAGPTSRARNPVGEAVSLSSEVPGDPRASGEAADPPFQCPRCTGTRHQHAVLRWAPYFPLTLHELLLGQRFIKEAWSCEECAVPRTARSFVRCGACFAWIDSRTYAWANGVGHWFGFACPECGGEVPTHLSLWSRVLRAPLWPLWVIPARALRPWWWRREIWRARAQLASVEASRDQGLQWVRMAVLVGFLWWVMMGLAFPVAFEAPWGTRLGLAWSAAIWFPPSVIFGLAFGYAFHLFVDRMPRRPEPPDEPR